MFIVASFAYDALFRAPIRLSVASVLNAGVEFIYTFLEKKMSYQLIIVILTVAKVAKGARITRYLYAMHAREFIYLIK